MKLTKTWLSYIVWGIFSVILFADIGIAAIEIYQKADTVDFLIPIASMYAYAILGVILLIVFYKIYEKFIMPKLEFEESEGLKKWQEGLILALILVSAIAIRAVAVIASGGELVGSTKYYDFAVATGSNQTLDTYNNGSYIYCGILNFLLGFFGHMPRAAMAVQAGIQAVTLIFLYFVVKKGIGRFAAWVALSMASFLPGSFLGVKVCSPDTLFTLFFVVFMFCLIQLCEANREQKIKIGAHGGFYILMGLFAAFLAYYDVAGWLCVVIACIAFAQSKNEDAWMKIQRAWLQILLFMITFVSAFLLMLWFIPANGLEVGPSAIVSYFTELISHFGFNLMILSPHKGEWDVLALFILAGLWFAGFLRDLNDKAFPYSFTVVVLTMMSFFGIGAYEYTSLVSVSWILIATIGITSIGVFRKTDKDVEAAQRAKQNSEERKAEKERRRAEAAGEKSIRLDDVHQKKKVDEPVFEKESLTYNTAAGRAGQSNVDTIGKKSYGIGRKTEGIAETAKSMNVTSYPNVQVNEKQEDDVRGNVPVRADSPYEVKTVVRTVDRPPVAETPTAAPIESKPAYSQGSRSRRVLRQPSKSTFTQEDLDRISRYTGANLVTASTLENRVDEQVQSTIVSPVPQPETSYIVSEPVKEDVTETVVESVVEEISEQNAVSQMNYIQLENNEVTVTNESVEDKPSAEEDKQEDSVVQQVQSTPALSYGSPARRHYRHPSKSTFSPEELEKISQYTGVSYKQTTPVDNNKDATVVTIEKTVEKTIGGARVIETKPADSQVTDVKTDVKPQAERKPKLIRNPLPGPKPHVAKELNYDYLPKESEMKFDIEDLKGRDYYDL